MPPLAALATLGGAVAAGAVGTVGSLAGASVAGLTTIAVGTALLASTQSGTIFQSVSAKQARDEAKRVSAIEKAEQFRLIEEERRRLANQKRAEQQIIARDIQRSEQTRLAGLASSGIDPSSSPIGTTSVGKQQIGL